MKNTLFAIVKQERGKIKAIIGHSIHPDIESAEAWFRYEIVRHLTKNTQNHRYLTRPQLYAFFGADHSKEPGLYRVDTSGVYPYKDQGTAFTLDKFSISFRLLIASGFQEIASTL